MAYFKSREKTTLSICQAAVLNNIDQMKTAATQNIAADRGRFKAKRQCDEQFQKALRTDVNDLILHKQSKTNLDKAPDQEANPCTIPKKPERAKQ